MPPRTEPLTLPFPVLVGDIGGTNARFAQLDAPDAELHIFPTAATAEHESPVEAIETVVFAAEKDRPKTLIFALGRPHQTDKLPLGLCAERADCPPRR